MNVMKWSVCVRERERESDREGVGDIGRNLRKAGDIRNQYLPQIGISSLCLSGDCLSVCLPVSLSIRPSECYLSVWLSVSLSNRLPLCCPSV